jgi:CO/xanthine dehydrogenase FAD-binding subunit/aerobic-type carbon monoxide dehydrogenase small subunit (CoxS/CutS family)
MKPPVFTYFAPDTLESALEILAHHGRDAKLLAGGQSLIPAMNFRLTAPAMLVDLNRIPGLSGIEPGPEGGIRVGALTRQAQAEHHPLVQERAPLLHETLPFIAHPQIRNRGTIGGSLAHADPAAELPVIALALNARFKAVNPRGERWIEAPDFFQFMFTTALEPGEILTEIEFPAMPDGAGWAFVEFARRLGDYALAGVAVVVTVDDHGVCSSAKIVYLNLGDKALDSPQAALALVGSPPTEATFTAAAEAAQADLDPAGSVHGSPAYQRHLAKVLTKRALRKAFERTNQYTGKATNQQTNHSTNQQNYQSLPLPISNIQSPISLTINHTPYQKTIPPRLLLSDFLRHEVGLTGTHVGCEHGVCGACTVLMDGHPVRSCLTFAVQAHGHEITTVEGLAPSPDQLHPLQQGFWEKHGLQCGFCTPGILMTLVPFLEQNPHPTEDEIRHALAGNLCRCTGYQHIVEAVQYAAEVIGNS